MPSPTQSLATLRPDIAGSFEEFDLLMDRQGFIGLRILPVFESAVASGTFGRIPLEQLLQSRRTERAPGAGYARGNWTFEPESFGTQEHGAEEPIDDREAKLYAEYFDAEVVSAARAMDAVLRNQEVRVAAFLHDPAVYTGPALSSAIVNEWDDHQSATPIDDVLAATLKFWEGSGIWPNALQVNRRQFLHLRQCEQIIDRISSAGAGDKVKAQDITAQLLASCFDLDELIVAGSAKNTANEGQAADISMIWSDEYASLLRVAKGNDIKEPCIGRTIHWGADGSQIGGTFETYRDETVRSDIVRARHEVQEKRLYTPMAHLLSNVLTL